MLTIEQQQQLIELCKTSQRVLENTTKQRDEAVNKLQANTELLNKSTQSIQVLLRFIEANGLQPPQDFAA